MSNAIIGEDRLSKYLKNYNTGRTCLLLSMVFLNTTVLFIKVLDPELIDWIIVLSLLSSASLFVLFVWNRIILFSLGQRAFYLIANPSIYFITMIWLHFFELKKNRFELPLFLKIVFYAVTISFVIYIYRGNAKVIRESLKKIDDEAATDETLHDSNIKQHKKI